MSALRGRIIEHLAQLYPEHDLEALADQVMAVAGLDPDLQSLGRQGGSWDQSDVYLISYGDSLQRESEPPLQTLDTFLSRHLEGSISGLHLLPFFPWSSDDGFAVSDYLAVNPALGDWPLVRSLAGKFKLMADLVINHCSSQHPWFSNFCQGQAPGHDYFYCAEPSEALSLVVRPRTNDLLRQVETPAGLRYVWCTFGHDQVDLDFRNPQVLLEFIRIIRFYLDQGVRVLRLDAVAFVWKLVGTDCLNLPETHELVRLLRTVVEHVDPATVIITETNIPKRENLSYFGNANEAHGIYNFSLPPLLLFTLLTGNCRHLKNWLMSMPPAQEGTFYFNFLASHDGIGLRPAEGLLSDEEIELLLRSMERFGGQISWRSISAVERRPYELNIAFYDACRGSVEGPDVWQEARFLCAHAILLALEGIPAFYIHSLFATGNDLARFQASGHKRHINRHRWDVQRLEVLLEGDSHHGRIFRALKRLMGVRRQQPAFHPNATQFTMHLGDQVFAFWRQSLARDQSIFAINNISDQSQVIPLSAINLIDTEQWQDLISGERISPGQESLHLTPYQTVWLSNRLGTGSG